MGMESTSVEKVDLVKVLPDGRLHFRFADGTEQILGKLSKSELKTAYVLEQNVEQLFRIYPIENIGFLSISFAKYVCTPKEASRRFNSFNTNCLKEIVLDYIKVTEPQKNGRPHYHLLVALESDIQTGFDWDSQQAAIKEYGLHKRSAKHRKLTKNYSRSATPYLRSLWKTFREAEKKYGTGRAELLPIRTCKEAAARYIAKYIEKCTGYRVGQWKGTRLTSNSRSFNRAANCRFSWAASGQQWRAYLGEVAILLNIQSIEEFSKCLGSKWAYKLLLCCHRGLSPEESLHVVYYDGFG